MEKRKSESFVRGTGCGSSNSLNIGAKKKFLFFLFTFSPFFFSVFISLTFFSSFFSSVSSVSFQKFLRSFDGTTFRLISRKLNKKLIFRIPDYVCRLKFASSWLRFTKYKVWRGRSPNEF